ncbi:hypothetical protein ACH5RR_015333 [Cinchona calisaya]|uniref:Uncharacterized protein n=1 Tax=Cinchona calisaya TaxID=153742 RepID=A0ABD2ZTP2_9GENT
MDKQVAQRPDKFNYANAVSARASLVSTCQDSTAFDGVITAYNHARFVDEGQVFFTSSDTICVTPPNKNFFYASLINLESWEIE